MSAPTRGDGLPGETLVEKITDRMKSWFDEL